MTRLDFFLLRRIATGIAISLVFALVLSRPTASQSIGIEGGITTVEGFDAVRPTVGLTVTLPLTQRLRIAATGTQWSGCPETGCDDPRDGIGNRGLNLVALFTALDGRRTDLSVGAGIGWFEVHRATDGESRSAYDEALTFAAEVRRDVAFNSGMYLRGETSFPIDGADARWLSLRLGVDVRIF